MDKVYLLEVDLVDGLDWRCDGVGWRDRGWMWVVGRCVLTCLPCLFHFNFWAKFLAQLQSMWPVSAQYAHFCCFWTLVMSQNSYITMARVLLDQSNTNPGKLLVAIVNIENNYQHADEDIRMYIPII